LWPELTWQLNDILNYNSLEISKRSTISTEKMTHKMELLTVKTVQETVMMRVIAVVTVIFLPGTFISVSRLAFSMATS
jgi:hypothetical protein